MEILLLCTANQCRSPMAEVLLQRRLADAGVAASVSSAGLYPGGSRATPHGVETMAARGLDLSQHRSRQLGSDLVEAADLVIGMAREHVLEATVASRDAFGRTFTLKELVRRGGEIGARKAGETLPEWLGRVGAGREPKAMLGVGHDPAHDVADPVGKGPADYEMTADELDGLLSELVALAWPPSVVQHEQGSA